MYSLIFLLYAASGGELDPKRLKSEFREFCSGYYINQIDSWFTDAGFDKYEPRASTRLDQVDGYYSKIDWENQNDIQKFLKVIESILLYNTYHIKEEHKQTLRGICEKSGFQVDSNGYTIHLTKKLGHQNIKNIIFASNSFKRFETVVLFTFSKSSKTPPSPVSSSNSFSVVV